MRRPWVLAMMSIVLTAVSAGLLAGCVTGPSNGSKAAAQAKIRNALVHQLEALPGATITADVQSGLDTGQNNVGVQARLLGQATTAQSRALADSMERIIWLSHLDPMGRISITFTRKGSGVPVLQRLYQDEVDTRPLGVRYGPRPDGLPG